MKRMNRNRLNIGVYVLAPYARSEQHIKELSECGVDFVVCFDNDRVGLDLLEKYGIGAIVTNAVPGWWGGFGENAGKMSEMRPLDCYYEAAKAFIDHPAIWGIDIGDEPSAKDFPHYGKVYSVVDRLFPHQFPYLNLYPAYASVAQNNDEETISQLGTATYDEYVAKYCEYFPADYICYDYYPYSTTPWGHFANLKIVADAARNSGRSMWIVLQVNSNDPDTWIREDQLRFQAYSALTFGAEIVTWACYSEGGWWYHNVLDAEGNKTEQYDKLKRVNAELHTIAEEYMRFRRTETHFVDFSAETMNEIGNCRSVASLNTGVFYDLKAENGTPLVVGEMVSRNGDGSVALMVMAADRPCGDARETATVRFDVEEGRTLNAYSGDGKVLLTRREDGSYAFSIASNQGVLIIAK